MSPINQSKYKRNFASISGPRMSPLAVHLMLRRGAAYALLLFQHAAWQGTFALEVVERHSQRRTRQKIEKQKRVPIVSDLVLVYKWSKWLLRVKKAMKQKGLADGVDAAKPAYLEEERKRILHAAALKLENVVEDGPKYRLSPGDLTLWQAPLTQAEAPDTQGGFGIPHVELYRVVEAQEGVGLELIRLDGDHVSRFVTKQASPAAGKTKRRAIKAGQMLRERLGADSSRTAPTSVSSGWSSSRRAWTLFVVRKKKKKQRRGCLRVSVEVTGNGRAEKGVRKGGRSGSDPDQRVDGKAVGPGHVKQAKVKEASPVDDKGALVELEAPRFMEVAPGGGLRLSTATVSRLGEEQQEAKDAAEEAPSRHERTKEHEDVDPKRKHLQGSEHDRSTTIALLCPGTSPDGKPRILRDDLFYTELLEKFVEGLPLQAVRQQLIDTMHEEYKAEMKEIDEKIRGATGDGNTAASATTYGRFRRFFSSVASGLRRAKDWVAAKTSWIPLVGRLMSDSVRAEKLTAQLKRRKMKLVEQRKERFAGLADKVVVPITRNLHAYANKILKVLSRTSTQSQATSTTSRVLEFLSKDLEGSKLSSSTGNNMIPLEAVRNLQLFPIQPDGTFFLPGTVTANEEHSAGPQPLPPHPRLQRMKLKNKGETWYGFMLELLRDRETDGGGLKAVFESTFASAKNSMSISAMGKTDAGTSLFQLLSLLPERIPFRNFLEWLHRMRMKLKAWRPPVTEEPRPAPSFLELEHGRRQRVSKVRTHLQKMLEKTSHQKTTLEKAVAVTVAGTVAVVPGLDPISQFMMNVVWWIFVGVPAYGLHALLGAMGAALSFGAASTLIAGGWAVLAIFAFVTIGMGNGNQFQF